MRKTAIFFAAMVVLAGVVQPAVATDDYSDRQPDYSGIEYDAFWEAFDLQIQSMVDPTPESCEELGGDYNPAFHKASAEPYLALIASQQDDLSEHAAFLLTPDGEQTYLDYLEVAWEKACWPEYF